MKDLEKKIKEKINAYEQMQQVSTIEVIEPSAFKHNEDDEVCYCDDCVDKAVKRLAEALSNDE